MDFKWVHSSAYSSIPPNAVIGGNDTDGSMIYVGRSFHNGDMLVAKVIPSKHIGFVSWRGEEIPKDHFEILCGQRLVWRRCYDHVIPENAVLCGKTSLDQPVYIGRGHWEGSLTVGKISSVHRSLFIPFGGAERRLETYEVLVYENDSPPGWAIDLPTPTPPPLSEKPYPLPPPFETKPPMYTPPMYTPPMYTPPMPQPPPMDVKPSLYPPPPPMDTKPPMYTPTPQPPQFGVPVLPTAPPPTGPPPPYAPTPEIYPPPLSSCTAPRTYDLWVNASASYQPSNAVVAGHDTDLSTIYVSRAFHEGNLIPGKAVPCRGCTYVSHAGQEVPKSNYEILVGDKYHWVPAHDGNIVPGAVEGGRTASGEPLFVGRAHYNGSLTPGKVQRSHQCLYIAFGGSERRITHYEVLVRREDYYREQAIKMQY